MKSYTNQGIRLAALLTSTLAFGGLFLVAPAAHAAYGVAPSPVINEACGGNRYSPTCLENAWNYDAAAQVQASYRYYPTRSYNYTAPVYNYVAPTYSYVAPTYNYNTSYVAPEPAYSYPTTSYYNDYGDTAYNTNSYSYEYADSYNYNYSDGSSDSYDYCNGS